MFPDPTTTPLEPPPNLAQQIIQNTTAAINLINRLSQELDEANAENVRLQSKIDRLKSEAELREVELENLKAQIHDLENSEDSR